MTLRRVVLAALLGGAAFVGVQSTAMAGQPAAPAGPVHPSATPQGHYFEMDKLPDWGGTWIVAQQRPVPGAPPRETPVIKPGQYLDRYNRMRAVSETNHGEWPRMASTCTTPGEPYLLSLGQYPSEYLFNPGRVTELHEETTGQRRIFTDGRGHAAPDDLELTYGGDAIGHWEGDTLVVETIGLKPSNQISNGVFATPKTRLVERIHLDPADKDALVDELTVTDEDMLVQPYHQTIRYRRHRDIELLEYVCDENNRNTIGADGKIDFH